MKFTLLLLLFAFQAKAQISTPVKLSDPVIVGKIAPLGGFIAQLDYIVDREDTAYTLSFLDDSYSKIRVTKSVTFLNKEDAVGGLYNILKGVFTADDNYKVEIKLGTQDVIISRHKSLGIVEAFITVGESYTHLTEKQINKLFGK
jgi:hypothetical protein